MFLPKISKIRQHQTKFSHI